MWCIAEGQWRSTDAGHTAFIPLGGAFVWLPDQDVVTRRSGDLKESMALSSQTRGPASTEHAEVACRPTMQTGEIATALSLV